MGRLTYTVRLNSLSGEQLGAYRHPGPEEPRVGTLLSPEGGLEGGPWRVSDYVQTDASAPANNVLVVERSDTNLPRPSKISPTTVVRSADLPARVKPRLRGMFHEAAFYAALVLGVPLIATAEPGRARLSASVFAAAVAFCFGASALYHRPTWRPRTRSWLARLDHAAIYLLIAGTYTPICLLVMTAGWRDVVLALVWSGAVAAVLLKLFWVRSPKWLAAVIALTLGWIAAIAFGQLLKIAVPGLIFLLAGGVLYSIGAIIYARKRPDPLPHVFGYHELFHVLTIAAVGCHYAAIAFWVLPRA